MEIETRRATLDTMAVTIRALHVDKKQMTLAVFRQLPEDEVLWDDEFEEGIELWGVVNYTIKSKFTDENEDNWGRNKKVIKQDIDIWVVYNQDNTLHRSKIPEPEDVSILLEELKRCTDQHNTDRVQRNINWAKRRNTNAAVLHKLPQLFIAV